MLTAQDLLSAAADYQPIAPATRKGWQYGIKGFEDTPVETIDEVFVTMRRVSLNRAGYKPGYVRTLLGYCGTIWKIGGRMKLVSSNPWRGSLEGLNKGKKEYPYLPLKHYSALHDEPLFMGMWYHGFRVNELAGIEPEDVVLKADIPYIHIRPNSIRGIKNRPSIRKVPIHPLYEPFIHRFKFTRNPNAGDYYSRRMKKIVGHSAHGIRHNITTRMRKAGIEYSIAAAILGHDASGMTANYGHILLEDMAEQIQKLS